ncbi:MAG TPA: tetratricopeptide repeat protein, partial [Alphaproteobacteria bacterium]|nr:tetratricopeptide repeat protein [Alphaproteobacteria bacterium]
MNRGPVRDTAARHFALALAAYQRRDYPAAVAAYRAILARDRNHVDALANLGAALRATGDLPGAIDAYRRALAQTPQRGDIWFNLGNAERAAANYELAIASFREAVKHAPRFGGAWLNMGLSLKSLGRHAEAIDAFAEAARLMAHDPLPETERGSALKALDRLDEAIAAHRAALARSPGHAIASYNLANALSAADRGVEAEMAYRDALKAAPDFAEAITNLAELLMARHDDAGDGEAESLVANALRIRADFVPALLSLGRLNERRKRWPEAAAAFVRANAAAPDDPAILRRLAHALFKVERFSQAEATYRALLARAPGGAGDLNDLCVTLGAQGRYDEAVALIRGGLDRHPDHAALRLTLGTLLLRRHQMDEAIPALEVAVRMAPDDVMGRLNLSNALTLIGRLGEALTHCAAGLALEPANAGLHSNRGFALCQQGRVGEGMAAFDAAIAVSGGDQTAHSNLLFAANYRDDLSAAEVAALHRVFAEKLRPTNLPRRAPPAARRKLRVGYLSPDFRQHSVAYFFAPLAAAHDAARIELCLYANSAVADAMTARIRRHADLWRNIEPLNDIAAAELIHGDDLDILVDLAGHTSGNRMGVMARKPARLQATYLGYPNTTGLPEVDFRLTDAIADPPGDDDDFYSERLWRLPRCFLAYLPPDEAPEVAPPPSSRAGRITFGSFNNQPKIAPGVIAAWARILRRVPDSRLLMKTAAANDPDTRARYMTVLAQHGVAPERLRLVGYRREISGHLALYGEIDVALDPFPYNGTTTTCEALYMGVPVVTMR